MLGGMSEWGDKKKIQRGGGGIYHGCCIVGETCFFFPATNSNKILWGSTLH